MIENNTTDIKNNIYDLNLTSGTELKKCKYCNKEYISFKSRKSKYCSADCYNKARRLKIKYDSKICPICGEKFRTYNHDQIYCSSKCCGISQQKRTKCNCANCGKEIERKDSEIINNTLNFCSLDCRYEYFKWSDSDSQLLIDNYGKIKTKELQSMLSKAYSTKAINSQAIRLGLTFDRSWTKKEEKIINDNYEKIPIGDLLKLLPNRTINAVRDKAHALGLNSYNYLSKKYSDSDIEYLKNNYSSKTNEELGEYLNHSARAIQQRLGILGLYRPTDLEKLYYKELASFVRANIQTWRNSVREKNNFTCELTGTRTNIIIHHCRSFNLILNEAIELTDFIIKENFNDYDIDKLDELVQVFLDLQEYYKEYVCINEDIHRLFHKEYGYGNNTMEQWNEFVEKYRNRDYESKVS